MTSAGLNRADANYRRGTLSREARPARAAAASRARGIVDAVGDGVAAARVGDRVGVLPSSFDVVSEGAAAESMTVPAAVVVRDAVDRRRPRRRLRSGCSVSPRGARSSRSPTSVRAIGSSCRRRRARSASPSIQLCRALGAKVIATTTSAQKVEALRRFAPDAIIDTRAEPYVERVQAITGGAGARVDLRPDLRPDRERPHPGGVPRGDRLRVRRARLHAARARARRHAAEADPPAGLHARTDARRSGAARARRRGDHARSSSGGDFAPVVDSYFPLDQIQAAHRHLESNRQIGKIVVTP